MIKNVFSNGSAYLDNNLTNASIICVKFCKEVCYIDGSESLTFGSDSDTKWLT